MRKTVDKDCLYQLEMELSMMFVVTCKTVPHFVAYVFLPPRLVFSTQTRHRILKQTARLLSIELFDLFS